MEGRIFSHYRVLAHLGGGGMGVVYKAEDTRLKRPVALKFLAPELTRDPEARERFVQEAQAASALDHPNICTIYEIDSAEDGQLFIAMAYCDGETLKRRLQRGPLPIAEAIDVAIQMGRGLDKAHHAGIVHRDIKPANVMVVQDGLVKIVDFGIAKILDHTGPTRAGTTLGTVAYMAPEQVKGGTTDERSDVWASGVVLYEMLTGRPPFAGEHEMAILNNIVNQVPPPVTSLRADVPDEVAQVVNRALAKRPEDRYASAAELVQDLVHCHLSVTGPVTVVVQAPPPVMRRRFVVAAAVVVLAAVAAPAGWLMKRNGDARRVDAGIAEVSRLADKDDYAAAASLAEEVERRAPNDPRLIALWQRISTRGAIDADPPGAEVYIRPYADLRGAWKHLGRSPIADTRVPVGALRWKIEKDGFDTAEVIRSDRGSITESLRPSGTALNVPFTVNFRLTATGSVPPGMLLIPPGNLNLTLTGFFSTVAAGAFLIDKYEVTNREFKEFVDAGGYTRREYWKQPFIRNGQTVPWEQAIGEFGDRTGRPGPATWEVGTYPAGQDAYPAGGVSWYEAAAYAEFAGKSLPTIYHWLRAAGVGAAASITPLSNLEGKGPAPVGSHQGVSPAGAFDTAGNVKEWCWNEIAPGGSRYILGGSWKDAAHLFSFADGRSPFDRSETNGFRLARYLDGAPLADALTRSIESPTRDFRSEKPVPEQVFQAFRAIYTYDPRPLDAKVQAIDNSADAWVKQKVSFRAAYGDERLIAYLFLPKNARPPWQTIVYAPGANAINRRSSDTLPMDIIDFVMLSGRALMYPLYKGTYERNTGQTSPWPDLTRAYQDWMVQVVNDARRSVDYLEARDDIKRESFAYYGLSWGAYFASQVLVLEPRFKAAVLLDGGLVPTKTIAPSFDSFNFAPRVKTPVLMLNAQSDYIFPVDTLQKPLFAALGTPPDQKRHVVFPGGHGDLSQRRTQVVKEALDWLDRYLGPVQR